MSDLIISCPHCNQFIFIKRTEFNCRIFRCGVYKYNFTQISPHLDEISCELLVKNKSIYGCSKPFRIDDNDNVLMCDYI